MSEVVTKCQFPSGQRGWNMNECLLKHLSFYSVVPSYEASYKTSQMFCFEDTGLWNKTIEKSYRKPHTNVQVKRLGFTYWPESKFFVILSLKLGVGSFL